MPLTDLIRYFNAAEHAETSTLYQDGEQVAAWHKGLRLTSLFQPIVDLRQECIVGHHATLQARLEDGSLISCAEAYARHESPEAIIHFDRLIRTLHALNLLSQRRQTGGFLQMTVHSRHVQAVHHQHGLVYEAILKRCGLGPEDIVLEFDLRGLSGLPHLATALNNYRQRGYRVAVSDGDLAGFKPDIVTLAWQDDATWLAGACQAGLRTQIVGITSGQALVQARAAGAELGQGSLFGLPERNCRPTHSRHRVAYNSASPFGATP